MTPVVSPHTTAPVQQPIPLASTVALVTLAAFLSIPCSSTRVLLGFTKPEPSALDPVHTDSTVQTQDVRGQHGTEQAAFCGL